jgi:glycosyltransferase involved in cell wall biosynthesis
MLALGAGFKRSLVKTYLASSSELTRRLLRERSGERDFRRVIVVAALSRHNGIANGARLQFNALQQLGIEAELLDATPALRNPLFRIAHRPGSAYIFHCGGPQTANLIASVLPHAANAYRVAYWAWELPDPPADWTGCDRNVSEIWTPSTFSRGSLVRLTSLPVAVVPHHVPIDRARVRRPNRPFTVLSIADSRSSLSRKNPDGALRAFQAAFGQSPAARLVLKLGGRDDAWDAFKAAAGDLRRSGNIEIVTDYLNDAQMASLYRQSDVLLCLHRAEGFGLPMLEAMAHGVPVVATGWSGNLDFMTEADSHLVPYKLVAVHDESGIYADSSWAEPDVQNAAQALRRLAGESAHYARCAAAAHRRAATLVPSFPFSLPERNAQVSQAAFA